MPLRDCVDNSIYVQFDGEEPKLVGKIGEITELTPNMDIEPSLHTAFTVTLGNINISRLWKALGISNNWLKMHGYVKRRTRNENRKTNYRPKRNKP